MTKFPTARIANNQIHQLTFSLRTVNRHTFARTVARVKRNGEEENSGPTMSKRVVRAVLVEQRLGSRHN